MAIVTLSEKLRSTLLWLLKSRSANEISKTTGVGREAIARAAAGLAIRQGTVALLEKYLAKKGAAS